MAFVKSHKMTQVVSTGKKVTPRSHVVTKSQEFGLKAKAARPLRDIGSV